MATLRISERARTERGYRRQLDEVLRRELSAVEPPPGADALERLVATLGRRLPIEERPTRRR